MKYKKRSRVIDAWLWDGTPQCAEQLLSLGVTARYTQGRLIVDTLEGPLDASVGDMIIRGVKGEYYPCKPDVFAESYDAVKEHADG